MISKQPPQRSQRRSSHSSSSKPTKSTASRTSRSFLFVVNELPINDDISSNGRQPRVDDYGRWLPPIYSNGFWAQQPGRVYRWTDGNITPATGYYYNGGGWTPNNYPLTEHRTTTMFFCNRWTGHLTANGDASIRDIYNPMDPNSKWWPLTFRWDGTLSRVEEVGDQLYLAGSGARWISQLGLSNYQYDGAPVSYLRNISRPFHVGS